MPILTGENFLVSRLETRLLTSKFDRMGVGREVSIDNGEKINKPCNFLKTFIFSTKKAVMFLNDIQIAP